MIFIALLFRAVGVAVCIIGTPLNIKERLFCIYCLFAESDRSGGYRLCAAEFGAFLREYSPFGCRARRDIFACGKSDIAPLAQ